MAQVVIAPKRGPVLLVYNPRHVINITSPSPLGSGLEVGLGPQGASNMKSSLGSHRATV
jgi:hypothetical protein